MSDKLYRVRVKEGLNRWFVKEISGVITYDKFSFTYYTYDEALKVQMRLLTHFDEVELA